MTVQARVAQLEIDNASLSQAAEEAATLAESLAAENVQLREQVSDMQEAIAGKDDRIARLSASVETQATNGQRLNNRIADLTGKLEEQYALAKVAEEMETTLRHTITALQQRLGLKLSSPSTSPIDAMRGTPAPLLSFIALLESILKLLPGFCQQMPQKVEKDMEKEDNVIWTEMRPMRLLIGAAAVDAVATYAVANFPVGATAAARLRCALADAAVAARRAASWVFQDAERVPERVADVEGALRTLRERVSASATDAARPSFPVTDAAPVDVQAGLIVLAVEAIDTYVRDVSAPSAFIGSDVSPALRETLRRRTEILRKTPRITDADRDVAKRLERTIAARERDLDDLAVRCAAFEAAVTSARKDVEMLRDALAIADAEVERLRRAVPSAQPSTATAAASAKVVGTVASGAASGAHSVATTDNARSRRGTESDIVVTDGTSAWSSDAEGNAADWRPTPLERRDTQLSLRRLRACYLRGVVSDLQSRAHGNARRARIDDLTTHAAMSGALQRARSAAANAHVVRLNPRTLQPTTCGATMSRRALLEAISAGRAVRTHHSRSLQTTPASCATQESRLHLIAPDGDIDHVLNTLHTQLTR